MSKHLLFIGLLFIFLTGCSKYSLNPEKGLEGQWKLYRAERFRLLNRHVLETEHSNGVFYFNDNGTAEYRDGIFLMNGNWNMRKGRDVYTDNRDNDQGAIHFKVNLYNFAANRVLNLDFDDCHFRSRNRFMADYTSASYRYRYEFRRY